MKYIFSEAIKRNIEHTYTFAHVKGAFGYQGSADKYNPHDFFQEAIERNPFKAFMELDGFQFKRTINTINRYGIPFTAEQERRAKIYHDVTESMANNRSDFTQQYIEGSTTGTGIIKLNEEYLLTTKETLAVAKFIKRLPTNKLTSNVIYENELSDTLLASKEQFKALKTSLEQHISSIIGGAGTGKSYVTAAVIDQLMLNDKKVAILAPTHKAKEALQEKLNRGTVRTIHSFVHSNKSEDHEVDAIVIDESGMLSTPLFHSLTKVYDGQQLIFIGDKNQLPPVEYGRPFELIQETHTVTELRQNHRSEARDIVSLGNQILGIPQNANLEPENIEVVNTTKEAFDKGAEVILSYTNANVQAINEERRIKHGPDSISPQFKIGESIIAKTNYQGKFYNGQLFNVTGFNTITNAKTGKTVRIASQKELDYNFDYAYALTIHKSQGSEFNVVAYQPSPLDSMELAYVAVTRAKKKLMIIGGLNDEYPRAQKWKQLTEIYNV